MLYVQTHQCCTCAQRCAHTPTLHQVHGAGNVATLRRLRRKLPVVKGAHVSPTLQTALRPPFPNLPCCVVESCSATARSSPPHPTSRIRPPSRRIHCTLPWLRPIRGATIPDVHGSQPDYAAPCTGKVVFACCLHVCVQSLASRRVLQFAAYFTMPSRGWFLVVCLMGLVFTILVRFRLGRWLLLRVGRTTASVQVTAPKLPHSLHTAIPAHSFHACSLVVLPPVQGPRSSKSTRFVCNKLTSAHPSHLHTQC